MLGMTLGELITALVIGAIAGWIASILLGSKGGLIRNIIIGVIGGIIGPVILNAVGIEISGPVGAIIPAVVGACALILVGKLLFK